MSIVLNGTTGITAPEVLPTSVPCTLVETTGTQTALANGVYTKINLDVSTIDTDSFFDSSTNYRFQPTISGYYYITSSVRLSGITDQTTVVNALYKNGSNYAFLALEAASGTTNTQAVGSSLVYLNGSTDYLEVWAQHEDGGTAAVSTNGTYFIAYLVSKA